MGLVVSLGLERFFYDAPDALPAAVASLVEGGYTTLVREIVAPERAALDKARVFEARRVDGAVTTRWLEPSEAKALLADTAKTYAKHTTFASFAWAQLEELGAYEIQPLALRLDGAVRPPWSGITLPGVDEPLRLIEVGDSLRFNWRSRNSQARAAAAFHRLAQKHRLIVHSA